MLIFKYMQIRNIQLYKMKASYSNFAERKDFIVV